MLRDNEAAKEVPGLSFVVLLAVATVLLGITAYFLYWPRAVFSPIYYEERDAFRLHPERFHPLSIVNRDRFLLEGIVHTPEKPACTVLYFGGKEQDSVALVGKMAAWFPEWRIAAFNYRGYGKSQGKPSEKALLDDAVFLLKEVSDRYGEIVVMGYSLGASVAAFAASRSEVHALIMVAPFYDIPTLAREKIPLFPAFLVRCRFDTARYLGGVTAPVYLFASEDDTVVPIKHSRALKSKIHLLAMYKEYSGYNHAEILGSETCRQDAGKVC